MRGRPEAGEDEVLDRAEDAAPSWQTALLDALVDSVTDEVWVADRSGRFVRGNASANAEFGAAATTMDAAELAASVEVYRADGTPRPVEEAPPLRALAGELVRDLEEIVRSPASGELRYRLVNAAPIRDAAGRVAGAVCVVRDVTERKRADLHIRRLSRVVRTVSEINQLVVRAEDPRALLADACRVLYEHGEFRMAWFGVADRASGLVVPVARAGADTAYLDGLEIRFDESPLGRGPTGTALRTGLYSVVADLAADPRVEPWRERQLSRGFRSSAAFPIRTGGNVTGVLTVYASDPFAIGDDEVALLVELAGDLGFALDALEERERRRAAEAELTKLSRAVEASSATVMITDIEGRIEYVNPKFTSVSGYTREEALGANPRLLKSGETPVATYRELWDTIKAGGVWRGELCNRRKDGRPFWELTSISPVLGPTGAITHFVAVKEDVTDRRRAEEDLARAQEQARQSQKMEAVGRLAGGVAHDFNNLLTVIRGYCELLSTSLTGNGGPKECVDEIVRAADRASALTRQLLAFSRRQVLAPRVLDLRSVVDDAERMFRRLIGEDVTLAVEEPEAPALVRADAGQIEQVLMNLVVNARDAMPDGGRLSIAVAERQIEAPIRALVDEVPPGRYVSLTVTDTGTGMDAETLSHAFEPFFTTKEPGKGTGLGLATVFGIVKQSAGFVSAASRVGEGSTFQVLLPRADAAESVTPPAAPPPVPRPGSGTILLVEDEPAVREVTRRFLERHGYRVLSAACGPDALVEAAAHDGPIHLLLTDLVMPGLSGTELARALAAVRPATRILYISGYPHDVLARQGLAEGEGRLMQKPFTEADLLRRVRESLDEAPSGGLPGSPDGPAGGARPLV